MQRERSGDESVDAPRLSADADIVETALAIIDQAGAQWNRTRADYVVGESGLST